MKTILHKISKLLPSLILLSLAFLLAIIFIILPSKILADVIKTENQGLALTILKQFSIFCLYILPPFFFKKTRFRIFLLAIIGAGYYTVIYMYIAFWQLTHTVFDPYFLIDSYTAVIPTGIIIFGKALMIILFISLIAFFAFISYLFIIIYNSIYEYLSLLQNSLGRYKYLLILPLIIIPLINPSNGFFTYNYKIINESQKAKNYFQPISPDLKPNLNASTANIFILQLESVNALVLQGQATKDNIAYPEIYIPNLHKIAEQGIFFPYFWSNSIQTDRAQENILCGLASNIGLSFSQSEAENLQSCLPNKLRTAGYKTIVFRSDKLEFNNMGNYLKNLGFDEVHYDDIMQPDDRKYKWGYDDCIFYQRSFEYLKKQYPNPSKLMVYFEVSSSHIPWENKEEYKAADKIAKPQNYTEQYINAESEQDYCLKKFYDEYMDYSPAQTHLMILSDTSSPIGINDDDTFSFQNIFNENFLTIFLYLPPFEAKQNYQTGKIINDKFYSHNDILPTIYELLSGQNFQNSFAYELQTNAPKNHEACQLLTQPYSGTYLIIINNNDKYIYSIIDKTVTHTNIITDPWETQSQIIENNVSFQAFKAKYFCNRYK